MADIKVEDEHIQVFTNLRRLRKYDDNGAIRFAKPGETCTYEFDPTYIICQHCSKRVTTVVTFHSGLYTWGVAMLLCLSGCMFGCCFIPFCTNFAKDVVHWCPECKGVVGVTRKC